MLHSYPVNSQHSLLLLVWLFFILKGWMALHGTWLHTQHQHSPYLCSFHLLFLRHLLLVPDFPSGLPSFDEWMISASLLKSFLKIQCNACLAYELNDCDNHIKNIDVGYKAKIDLARSSWKTENILSLYSSSSVNVWGKKDFQLFQFVSDFSIWNELV